MSNQAKAATAVDEEVEIIDSSESEIQGRREISDAELRSITEALIFVADEPISAKLIADVTKVDRELVEKAISALVTEYDEGNGGLQLREIAGGWQIATRPE